MNIVLLRYMSVWPMYGDHLDIFLGFVVDFLQHGWDLFEN